MRKDLNEKLIEKYPVLFRDHTKSPMQSLMCFGCEVGDGWFTILDELFAEWTNIMKEQNFTIILTQVKEKFGTLRVYYHATPNYETNNDDKAAVYDRIEELLRLAEEKSAVTCESCGKPGKLNNNGWIKCSCEDCKAKRNKPVE
jgi:hypothetical protein